MADRYRIEFTAAARRQLRKLPQPAAQRIRPVIDALAGEPRPAGVRALQGQPGTLRVRVGDYRILYAVEDDRLVILVIRVGPPPRGLRPLSTSRSPGSPRTFVSVATTTGGVVVPETDSCRLQTCGADEVYYGGG